MVVIDTNSNAVQEDLIIASHPTIDKCSGVQINLYLKLTKKKKYPKLTLSIHPSIHLTYHKNCISNSHYLSIHLSIRPSIHTSDLPQELSQTYTNQSIHPAYLKLTLIHPCIHPSCIANLHPPSIHLTYHKTCISNLQYPSKYLSIHTSDLPQKLSQTYTNPSIQSQYFTNPSIYPSFLYLKLTLSIHPSIHLTSKKNYL